MQYNNNIPTSRQGEVAPVRSDSQNSLGSDGISCLRPGRMRINQGILDAERSDQGGAGFIGQNFVHTWHRARPADRMVVIDAMIYADKREPLIADRSVVFVKRDTLDADLMRRLFEEHRLTRVAHLAAE